MPDFDNTPPVAIDLITPKTPDNTDPVAIDLATPTTPTAGAPTGIAINQTQDNTAPDAVDLITPKTPVGTDATAIDLITPKTPDNAAAVPIGEPPASLLNMPSTFVPAFVELAAGGNSLNTLNATAADIGKIIQGTVGGQLKSYQIRAGGDAQDLPGIVRLANFDAVNNAVVAVQL